MISKYDDPPIDTKYDGNKNGSKYDKNDTNFKGSKVSGVKENFRNADL